MLLQNCTKLNEVLLNLQTSDCTFLQLRVYSYYALEIYPHLEARLVNNAQILRSPHFSSCLAKDQEQKEMDLSLSEKRALRSILL